MKMLGVSGGCISGAATFCKVDDRAIDTSPFCNLTQLRRRNNDRAQITRYPAHQPTVSQGLTLSDASLPAATFHILSGKGRIREDSGALRNWGF
jgi:hypothetical protein